MQIIAVTGRSGSGKSTVASFYAEMGYIVLDGDQAARQILQPGTLVVQDLQRVFGADITDATGQVNRPLLAQRAFANAQTAKQLTDITHPAIVRLLLDGVEKARMQGQSIVFVDGAVIINAPFEKYCTGIILVTAPLQHAVARIMQRDGLTQEMATARLASQLPEEEMKKRADYIIENNAEKAALRHKALEVLRKIKGA